MSYSDESKQDAKDTASEYLDTILDKLFANEDVSDDLHNDYAGGDSHHHENHVDKSYTLQEAADLLDELSDHEETDNGLWEGQMPRQAISTQAAFTYGNAVISQWRDLIQEINSDDDLNALRKRLEWLQTDPTEREEWDEADDPINCELADDVETGKAKIKERLEEIIDGF